MQVRRLVTAKGLKVEFHTWLMKIEGGQIKAWSASSKEVVKCVPPESFLSKFVIKSIDLQLYYLEPWYTLQNPNDTINGTGPNK